MQYHADHPEQHFPSLRAKDLNGRELSLPADLPGERTILIIAYQREQQADVDTWTQGLHLTADVVPWLELPVIDDPGAFARWFIAGGMRRGIKDHRLWSHVVTLYTRKSAFKDAMAITSEKQVQAIVVDRTGKIVERVIGNFSEEGAHRISKAVLPQP